MMYTVETLKEFNEKHDLLQSISEEDVEIVNLLVRVIEENTKKGTPQVGDVVRFTDKYGNFSREAHVDEVDGDVKYICENPYIPFTHTINEDKNIETSTSGGAWRHIDKPFKHEGMTKKVFKSASPRNSLFGSMSLMFEATVNVWRYTEGNPQYTTEFYDKYFVSVVEDRTSISDYKYVLNGSFDKRAFHTDEQYRAWLKTFHGVEEPEIPGNAIVVWTHKQIERCIPLEDYLNVSDAVIDSTLCNGKIQQCKRVSKDKTVITYIPHQNDMIILPNTKEFMRAYMLGMLE